MYMSHASYQKKIDFMSSQIPEYPVLFDEKYINFTTGKFDRERLPVLSNISLGSLIESGYDEETCEYDRQQRREELRLYKEYQRKNRKRIKETVEHVHLAEEVRVSAQERAKLQDQEDCERRAAQNARVLIEMKRILKENESEDERIYLSGPNSGQRIITSQWKYK